MIYHKDYIYTCNECHKTFKKGHLACGVIHYSGCCHYGDQEVEVVLKTEEPGKEGEV